MKIDNKDGGSVASISIAPIGNKLEVKANAGDDLIDVISSTVIGETKMTTGADDDTVNVFDTIFADFEADGGSGTDTFEDLGGTSYAPGSPVLLNFESILP